MNRNDYINGLNKTIPALTDSQIQYLYCLVEELFGIREDEAAMSEEKRLYTLQIAEMVEQTNDIPLLDLIYKLLCKSV